MGRALSLILSLSMLSLTSAHAGGCLDFMWSLVRRDPRITYVKVLGRDLTLEFDRKTQTDRLIGLDSKANPLVLYEGRIHRIPIRRSIFKKGVHAPLAIRNRVSVYEYDPPLDDFPLQNFALGVSKGTLLVTLDSGEGGDWVTRLTTYFVPVPIQYVVGGSVREVDVEHPPTAERDPVNRTHLSDEDSAIEEFDPPPPKLLLISLVEGERNGWLSADEIFKEVGLLVKKKSDENGGWLIEDGQGGWTTREAPSDLDTHYEYEIPRNRYLSFVMRPLRIRREFSAHRWRSLRQYEGKVLRLPGDFSYMNARSIKLEGDELVITPHGSDDTIDLGNPAWKQPVRFDVGSLLK